MSTSRLSLYLESGVFALPDAGEIAVFGAAAGDDLSGLPKERLRLVARMKPDVDALRSAGFKVDVTAPEAAVLALVILPRAKAEARAMVAQAVDLAGCVIVDGQKTEGVDSIFRDMRKLAECSEAYSKAHGKTFVAKAAPGTFAAWAESGALAKNRDGFTTAPGVFSADAVDPASRLLIAALPKKLGRKVADFGAGWGFLASEILKRDEVRTLDLVEADYLALECAKQNVGDERARFHWADAMRWTPEVPLDAVVMNPPFHEGRKGVPELGQAFIRQAASVLSPGGRLYMVANRHLPYEQALGSVFREVKELDGDGRFKIFVAARPSRKTR
ncbi:class I SAM-dependent methyltransferase [Rhodobacteraceae bacterium D3-12]|nr:class I SAM-dependent methyltransferase [Rhodobacteraceae bacterium D3-12]